MSFTIGPQDMGRRRNFEINDFKFVFEASDPYGFISAYCTRTKESLPGQYTDFKAAEAAAAKYSLEYSKRGSEGSGQKKAN